MERLTFWSFIWRCIDRAATDTAHFFGWDLKTVLTAIGLIAFGYFIHWRVKGLSETKREVSKFLIITAAPLIVFLASMLLYNAFRAPYLVYKDEHDKAQRELDKMRQRVDGAEREKAQFESAIRKLQEQLDAKTKVIVRPQMPAPGAEAAELARLRSELDQREKRKQIRRSLANYLEQGQNIMGLIIAKPELKDADIDEPAEKWGVQAEEYLRKNLGDEYVVRFRSAIGIVSVTPNTKPNTELKQKLWWGMYVRLDRLTQFLEELKD